MFVMQVTCLHFNTRSLYLRTMDVKSLIKVFSNPGEFGYGDTNVRRPIALDVRLKGQSLPKRRDYSPTETDTINMSRNIAPIYKRVSVLWKDVVLK